MCARVEFCTVYIGLKYCENKFWVLVFACVMAKTAGTL